MALPVAPMVLPAANDDNGGQFTTHHVVDTHVRGKALSVVYMNDTVSVESYIQTMEQFLPRTSTEWSASTSSTP